MYADQELQKIDEERKYKERQYLQQRERERNRFTQPQGERVPVSFPKDQEETQVKAINTESSIVAPVSTPVGLDTRTQTVSSTNVVPTLQVIESVVPCSENVDWQRQQGQLDALRTAASLRTTASLTGTSIAPSQIVVTTTPETEMSDDVRQVPVGSIVPNTERYVWPGHPDAQYINVFPSDMAIHQTDPNL